MHKIYVLYSPTFNRYYVGSTQNVQMRLKKHNAGGTKSTKPFRPWIMVYQEEFLTKTEARKRENQIKSFKHGEAFKKLLRAGTEVDKRS